MTYACHTQANYKRVKILQVKSGQLSFCHKARKLHSEAVYNRNYLLPLSLNDLLPLSMQRTAISTGLIFQYSKKSTML